MTRPLLKYLSKLLPLIFIAVLTGCASGPPIYTSSAADNAAFQSLQTNNPKLQAERFGAYAKVAGKSFIGRYDGRVLAVSYHWTIPGVVLEKKGELPWRERFVLQYNPESRKIDVFNLLAQGTKHIREVLVLPDGSVEWPSAMLGIISAGRRVIGENGSLDYTDISGKVLFTLHEVSSDEFQSTVAEVRAYRNARAREKSRSRSEFMNAVVQGLGQASQEIRAENQTYQLREAERQSEIMRLKDAEMRASSRRLAKQQRETEIKERQQTQKRAAKTTTGYITVIDDSEEKKKRSREIEERKRQVKAQEEASQKARAQGKVEWAAKVAEIEAEAAKKRRLIPKGSTATAQ